MAKKIATILLVLFLIPVLSFAQEAQIKQKAPLKVGPQFVGSSTPLGTDVPVTAANYIAVDTMANTYGPASPTLNPVAVDPYSNIAAVLHRGKTTYAQGSGELWWNTTEDNGATWQRSQTSVQNNLTSQIFARYPSMAIQNPTGSSNMADLIGVFAWPELDATAGAFLNVGYGVATGLMASDYAAIIPPVSTALPYGTNTPCWVDDQYFYWAADYLNTTSNATITFFRTADFVNVDVIEPPTWNGLTTFNDGGTIPLGGVAYDGVLYYGVQGTFLDTTGQSGWEPGYSKSTDQGATWSDWFVVNWLEIPATQNFTSLWDYLHGDAFISYAGDIQVDKDGHVHILTALMRDTTGAGGTGQGPTEFVEFFETSEGVWDAKILADSNYVHNNSFYETPFVGTATNTDPGIGQCGPAFMLATNMDRDFFVAQWDIGSTAAGDTLCDIFYSTRDLSGDWSAPINLTETDNMNEDGSHLAPYLATVNVGDTLLIDYAYSMFWYESGNTTPYIVDTNPTVVYIAAVPVRETQIVGVDDEILVNNFNLEQNYPNPFNPNTTIIYTLAERSVVSLKVYDVLGNEVASLVNSTQEAGKHNVNFDASKLSSGLYVYTINAGSFTSSRKMMLLK